MSMYDPIKGRMLTETECRVIMLLDSMTEVQKCIKEEPTEIGRRQMQEMLSQMERELNRLERKLDNPAR